MWKDRSVTGELIHHSLGQKAVLWKRAREKPKICVFQLPGRSAKTLDWDPPTVVYQLSEVVSVTPDPDRPEMLHDSS